MDRLYSVKEVLADGFIPESNSTLIKGKKRFIKCNCGAWTSTTKQPSGQNIITEECFWCKTTFSIKLINTFIGTKFSKAERHVRRIEKIRKLKR